MPSSVNTNKGRAYHMVMSKLKTCSETEDIFHLIGLIAASESIISDRLSAFLGGTKNENYKEAQEKNKFVSFNDLLKFSKRELKRKIEIKQKLGDVITTDNLHSELKVWIKKRNEIIHSVCKSKSKEIHKTESQLFSDAQATCINGHRLLRLLLKWSQQKKAENKKNQMNKTN